MRLSNCGLYTRLREVSLLLVLASFGFVWLVFFPEAFNKYKKIKTLTPNTVVKTEIGPNSTSF